eukprot:TRINITY_DN2956_c0_g3_i1.p1 TRINITY_DN2956_c0_g3~~TRINITY_DN2956_c0_g3_i1.p1  ORF type:complete len:338 (+),score=125.66 TRINITY_DN2956_c0_g3_i1:144-1016(+)
MRMGSVGLTVEDLGRVKSQLGQHTKGASIKATEAAKGKKLLTDGITEGADLLSQHSVNSIDWSLTEVQRVHLDHKNDPSKKNPTENLLHMAFTLNGVQGVQFSWEEEEANFLRDSKVTTQTLIYGRVSQFVIGARLVWGLLGSSRYLFRKLDKNIQTAMKAFCLAAGRKSLQPTLVTSILGYYTPDTMLPLALYWKAFHPVARSNPVKTVVRTYPPAFDDYSHPIFGDLRWVMRQLGIPQAEDPDQAAHDFFILLICMANNSCVLHDGLWQHMTSKSLYIPVQRAEDWGK